MDLVESARLYLDVPFQHQGRYEWAVDCGGLLILAARNLGIYLQDIRGYSREPDGVTLKQSLDDQLIRVSRPPMYGDVMLMAFQKNPQHIAIRTDTGMIHAYAHAGKVVEHVFSEKWQSRVKGVYTL